MNAVTNQHSASAQQSPPSIALHDIHTRFGTQLVHSGISLDIGCDELVTLVGGSGSGKTTLLRVIMGLLQPSAGSVEIFGHNSATATVEEWHMIRNNWGVLFQSGALFSALSVFDNIAFPLRENAKLRFRTIERLVMSKLDLVGLTAKDADKLPSELSGGMVKRVALARALINDPRILLLDEPTSGLDPLTADRFVALIAELRREFDLAAVLISHNLATIAELSDRIAVLADGKIVALGPLDTVRRSTHPFVEDYFRGDRANDLFGVVDPQTIQQDQNRTQEQL